MGFLDSVNKAKVISAEKVVKEVKAEVVTEAIVVPSSFSTALAKAKETPEIEECDFCGVERHCVNSKIEQNLVEKLQIVGKHKLCFTCAKVETQRLEDLKTNQISNIKELTEASSVPVHAQNKEDEYLKFFNQEAEAISSLTDEQLRDRIIHWGETLFEVKIKQQKDIIALKERAASKTKEERAKLRIDDLTYVPEEPIDSPIKEIQKRRTQKEKASESLGALGLDINTLLNKFKVK